ncbi:hypothetical protein QVD17_31276 [Tagetes erecta]|uniref:Uncharacterized protein n=1 Tax=Tagetes erecta TaxID=13708 RepID=A0AAD8K341_TARER|nr:hypothetical protein QVD17_31276 [Tagetes erecta]
MSRTISPATTTVMPTGTSFEEARFRSGEVRRLRLEMLAGKHADVEVGDDGGGGGDGNDWKNGWSSGVVVTEVDKNGIFNDDGGGDDGRSEDGCGDGGCTGGMIGWFCGKNGWCSDRRWWWVLSPATVVVVVKTRKMRKM